MSPGAKRDSGRTNLKWAQHCGLQSQLFLITLYRAKMLKSACTNPVPAFVVQRFCRTAMAGIILHTCAIVFFVWFLKPVKNKKLQSLVETPSQEWFTGDRKGELLALVTLEELLLLFGEVFVELTHKASCCTWVFFKVPTIKSAKRTSKGPLFLQREWLCSLWFWKPSPWEYP